MDQGKVNRKPVPWRWLLDPEPFHLRFVVDKVAQGQGFLWVLCFSFVSTIPPLLRTHLHLNTVSISNRRFIQEEATYLAALCFTLLPFLKNSKYYYEIQHAFFVFLISMFGRWTPFSWRERHAILFNFLRRENIMNMWGESDA